MTGPSFEGLFFAFMLWIHKGESMDKIIFTISMIQEGDTITIHAVHDGTDESEVSRAGRAILRKLAGTDSIGEVASVSHMSAPCWIQ